jgi:hypothetical protein
MYLVLDILITILTIWEFFDLVIAVKRRSS